jgi:hypothetical protein
MFHYCQASPTQPYGVVAPPVETASSIRNYTDCGPTLTWLKKVVLFCTIWLEERRSSKEPLLASPLLIGRACAPSTQLPYLAMESVLYADQ